MVGGELLCVLGFGAEGIDPSVQLHAAAMTLAYHPFEWVPSGILSLASGKPSAPRLVTAAIESVGLGAYLEHHGVDACRLQDIELLREVGLHLFAGESHELAIDALNPGAAHFALGSFEGVGGRRSEYSRQQKEEKEQYFFHYDRTGAEKTIDAERERGSASPRRLQKYDNAHNFTTPVG